jgi:hypothetical protein
MDDAKWEIKKKKYYINLKAGDTDAAASDDE